MSLTPGQSGVKLVSSEIAAVKAAVVTSFYGLIGSQQVAGWVVRQTGFNSFSFNSGLIK